MTSELQNIARSLLKRQIDFPSEQEKIQGTDIPKLVPAPVEKLLDVLPEILFYFDEQDGWEVDPDIFGEASGSLVQDYENLRDSLRAVARTGKIAPGAIQAGLATVERLIEGMTISIEDRKVDLGPDIAANDAAAIAEFFKLSDRFEKRWLESTNRINFSILEDCSSTRDVLEAMKECLKALQNKLPGPHESRSPED